MKYLLVGDYFKRLFVEDENKALLYDKKEKRWFDGTKELLGARIGFDPTEPPESPYRFGDLIDIDIVSKEEAEKFIGNQINENELANALKKV